MYSREHAEKWMPGFLWAINLHKKATDDTDRSIARTLLRKIVAKYSDRPPTMASKKALALAESKNKNLSEMRWAHRNRCGKINGKPALMWEHTTPNSTLCDKLMNCKTEEEIIEELMSYSGVCWITREEDDALNAAGYLRKRPQGWKNCYKSVGIEVIMIGEVNNAR